ncbi:MAG TPA: hypothetical protein VFW24_16410, partial [Acidimicrobiales bacterium]|nr:hypothetical protein [Acidimicrobiales bacterium]
MEVAELLERARPLAPAGSRALPVVPALAPLLPGGVRRGSTLALPGGPGHTSLLLALLAGVSASGAWCAVVGMPALGAEAAAAAGVDLGRLALVPAPGERWPTVVSALLDGIDVVAVDHRRPRPADARRLSVRARHHGAVLLGVGSAWPEADLVLRVAGAEWDGLGRGHGHLRQRRIEVEVTGRRAADRPRRTSLWLPSDSGAAEGCTDAVSTGAGKGTTDGVLRA